MDEKIKVTDKRMFTPEGELREEYASSDSGDGAGADRPASETVETSSDLGSEESRSVDASTDTVRPSAGAAQEQARKRLGARDGDFPAPTFVDLIGMLAQPIAMFLGDAKLPGGEAEENLPLARFHIDLLELVESKTKGNISAEEVKLLEDLLYQLRMRYIEKAG